MSTPDTWTPTDAELDRLAELMDLDSIPADMAFPAAVGPLSELAMYAAQIGLFEPITDSDVFCWAVPGGSEEGVLFRWITSPSTRYYEPELMVSTHATFPSELIAGTTTGRERARMLLEHAFRELSGIFGQLGV